MSLVLDLTDHRHILWMPGYHTDIPWWHGHIPFAFYLVAALRPARFVELGTHKGDSYMAMCQAVAGLGVSSECFAVDNWVGDQHVGALDESVYEDLKAAHDPLYGQFSQLLRMDFAEAAERFEDGSIDLLHIDGAHTYEDVSRDVRTWMPKLSRRGVLLMHDVGVRREDFGVHRVWEELDLPESRRLYFPHSAGLGVAAVGEETSESLLTVMGADATDKQTFVELFVRLGESLAYRLDPPDVVERVRAVSADHRF